MKIFLTIFAILAAWAIGELHGQARQSRADNDALRRIVEPEFSDMAPRFPTPRVEVPTTREP